MRFKQQSKILFSMESVALTDIIMNLFIFFFISFSFLATFHKTNEGQVEVNLPKATASTPPPLEKKSMVVSLAKEGGLFLDHTPLTLEQLRTHFQAEKMRGADLTLVVRADREVPHGRVVEVMDIARGEGLDHLAIGTQTR
jgi:biopolymer transport protein ExbD